jgi:hypothetical protein
MQVVAFSSPLHPEWRWRIVNYDGHMVEESYQSFRSIAAAVADGALRLTVLSGDDVARQNYMPARRSR